jgi:Flp pilus assembly protein TadB
VNEHKLVLISSGLLLAFALIGGIIEGSIYLIIAAVVGLLLLPVWLRVFRKIDWLKAS